MAITLRNKRVEDKIRAIGRRTGEGPSAVIARLVAAEEPGTGLVSAEEAARHAAEMLAYLDRIRRPTAEERRAVQQASDEMYDPLGMPR